MSKELAIALIETGENAVGDLFGDNETVIWIDWREDDAAIVQYFADATRRFTIKAKWENGQLFIVDEDKIVRIPLNFDQGDGDIAIRTMNTFLNPGHEIRFAKHSIGGDTLAFVPLSRVEWDEIDAQYLDKVGDAFERIGNDSVFFR